MGAGMSPACLRLELAGLDPQVRTAVGPTPAYPRALQFDPQTRAYLQDSTGKMVELDATDSKVALLTGIGYGDVPADPTFGQKLRQVLNRIDPSKANAVATQELQRLLRSLIAAGDIVMRTVDVQAPTALGQMAVRFSYKNLRAPGQPVRPVSL